MIKPAYEYQDQLRTLYLEASLNIKDQWYFSRPGAYKLEVSADTVTSRQLVSIDPKDDHIVGMIFYYIDTFSKSAINWGLLSFDKGNLILIEDMIREIRNIFELYKFNRVEFSCFVDNPAIRGYRRFVKDLGGRECSYFRKCAQLLDGQLHDQVDFEIMSEEYFESKFYKKEKEKENGRNNHLDIRKEHTIIH